MNHVQSYYLLCADFVPKPVYISFTAVVLENSTSLSQVRNLGPESLLT